jgi:pseudouridine-5'-phosphate glycosidase
MNRVALETTLILHGVPRDAAPALARELDAIVRSHGAIPALCAVINGEPVVGVTPAQLETLFAQPHVAKLNTASLGPALWRKQHGATTVSTTMELAAGAGVRLFATGGLGGVHRNLVHRLDISADLLAFTRFPVGVVTSGCKSILDVAGTRELLETLGVPVIGYRTDRFPAFYQRDTGALSVGVDARFDDLDELAAYLRAELARTARGVVICNPIPAEHEIPAADFDRWLAQAHAEVEATAVLAAGGVGSSAAVGRDVTPAILGALHRISDGATLKANIALVKDNARVAAELARRL